MSTKGSFFSNGSEVYTETSPAGPADTPVSSADGPAKSSFFGGTGQPYANVTSLSSTLEQVDAAASAAAASAAAALASATDAASHDSAVASSASAASTSATNAATSATNAAASAASALSHDTSSATHDTNSATSATNAATSESNALASKNAAATSATSAASSASAASSSASAAASSAASAASTADTEIAARAVRFDAAQSLTTAQKTQAQSNMGLTPSAGNIFGLAMSAPGAGTTLTINSGQATSDDFTTLMALASTYTKTTAAWAVGTAAGALDSGTISLNSWYHVFLIERTDTGVVDVLISLSTTSPTLPTNYTKKRRIGAVRTDASSKFLGFTQLGDEFLWLTPVADMSATASSTAAHSLTLTVPSNVKVWAKMIFGAVYATASISALMYAPDTGTQTDNSPTLHYQLFVASTATGSQAELQIRTNTSSQVQWTASAAGANMYCITLGWVDRRGRDA